VRDPAAERAVGADGAGAGACLLPTPDAAAERLRRLARDENVDLGKFDKLAPSDQAVYDRLTSKKGVDFDRDFTKLVIARHEEMIHQFELQRDHSHDAAVKEYASSELSSPVSDGTEKLCACVPASAAGPIARATFLPLPA